MKKYTTPTVGISAIFKNEAPYIIEWLAHHRLMGIHDFFIANNDSNDGTTELLDALQLAGYLTHHLFPTPLGKTPQVPAYEMLLREHGKEVDWMAFIDADELIWPTEASHDLPAFLAKLYTRHPDIGALALNWATYGSSGHIRHDDKPMSTRFTWHAAKGHVLNKQFKSIVKVGSIEYMVGPHHAKLIPNALYLHTDGDEIVAHPGISPDPLINECLSQTTCWQHFRINHYVVKSYSEFTKKRARGRAYLPGIRDNCFYIAHDNNDFHAPPSTSYKVSLDAEIHSIRQKARLFSAQAIGTNLRDATSTWSIPHLGNIDSIENGDRCIRLFGWAAPWGSRVAQSLKMRVDGGPWRYPQAFSRVDRTDVVTHHPLAPNDTGFVAYFDQHPPSLATAAIEIRAIAKGGLATDPIAMGKYAREHLK
ncbi:glycosyltransferase family 2 protein [Hydrogenophaga sp. PAMC20947]|uniref:glycosyltransferase family 2 protein n=1 Tax=Hydrogenophaga sp. PAMC20947 TaxID=2565558 RepID=UPI001444E923|nr:glycosyltransferase family 2 protein [Hydrogenophaga sp. PAMC20947]